MESKSATKMNIDLKKKKIGGGGGWYSISAALLCVGSDN